MAQGGDESKDSRYTCLVCFLRGTSLHSWKKDQVLWNHQFYHLKNGIVLYFYDCHEITMFYSLYISVYFGLPFFLHKLELYMSVSSSLRGISSKLVFFFPFSPCTPSSLPCSFWPFRYFISGISWILLLSMKSTANQLSRKVTSPALFRLLICIS